MASLAKLPRESCYELQDSCGVFGCIAAEGIDLNEFGLTNNIFLGLLGIQHRYIYYKSNLCSWHALILCTNGGGHLFDYYGTPWDSPFPPGIVRIC